MEKNHDQLIVLDFDHTLFNTTKFVDGLKEHFSKTFGVTPQQFEETLAYVKGMRTTQDIKTIVEHMPHQDKEMMQMAIFELASHLGPKALHTDVMKFIARHKESFDILILTFGDQEFQKAKVIGSGLGMFPYQVVQTNKAEAFTPFVEQYKKVYFIDDHPRNIDAVKEKYPEVVAYHMRRPDDDPYGEEQIVCKCADQVIENLEFTIE